MPRRARSTVRCPEAWHTGIHRALPRATGGAVGTPRVGCCFPVRARLARSLLHLVHKLSRRALRATSLPWRTGEEAFGTLFTTGRATGPAYRTGVARCPGALGADRCHATWRTLRITASLLVEFPSKTPNRAVFASHTAFVRALANRDPLTPGLCGTETRAPRVVLADTRSGVLTRFAHAASLSPF